MTRVIENLNPTRRRAGARPSPSMAAAVLALAALAGVGGGGCDSPLDDLNMNNTPRYEPGEPSDFFADGRADRNQVAGTVAQGQLLTDDNRVLRTGLDANGKPSAGYPFEITRADLERGKLRYDIYCAVCHNATGDGKGMVVQRGFVPPPSLVMGVTAQSNAVLDQRTRDLQNAPPGHFFQVISNGWGAMYSYNDRISVEDRWRIAAYVKVLQLSQNAEVATLPADVQDAVRNAATRPTGPAVLPGTGHNPGAAGHGTTTGQGAAHE